MTLSDLEKREVINGAKFFSWISAYACTILQIAIKFDMLTHVGEMLSRDQPRSRLKQGMAPALPVFLGTSIYAHSI